MVRPGKRQQASTKAVELYNEGVPTAEITRRTGITRPRLYAILEQEGVVPNRTRRLAVTTDASEWQAKALEQAEVIGALRHENEVLKLEIADLKAQLASQKPARRWRSD